MGKKSRPPHRIVEKFAFHPFHETSTSFHSSPYESIRITSDLGPLHRRRPSLSPLATLQIAALREIPTKPPVAKCPMCIREFFILHPSTSVRLLITALLRHIIIWYASDTGNSLTSQAISLRRLHKENRFAAPSNKFRAALFFSQNICFAASNSAKNNIYVATIK